jgi:hypothetical protein
MQIQQRYSACKTPTARNVEPARVRLASQARGLVEFLNSDCPDERLRACAIKTLASITTKREAGARS